MPMRIHYPTAMPASWPKRPSALSLLRMYCRPRRNCNRRLLARYLSVSPVLWTTSKIYV